jgi:hypothetical protein
MSGRIASINELSGEWRRGEGGKRRERSRMGEGCSISLSSYCIICPSLCLFIFYLHIAACIVCLSGCFVFCVCVCSCCVACVYMCTCFLVLYRDYMHYVDVIFCKASRIVDRLVKESDGLGFSTFHTRRYN